MKIIDIIKSVLPEGTAHGIRAILDGEVVAADASSEEDWGRCPAWPPDLFAVVATLVDRSSCYTLAGPDPDDLDSHVAYLNEVSRLAGQWTDVSSVPAGITSLWERLTGEFTNIEIDEGCEHTDVARLLLKLFAIADEACKGMGWSAPVNSSATDAGTQVEETQGQDTELAHLKIADLARTSLLSSPTDPVDKLLLPYAPTSLCSLVPMDIAIVLPKSMTAAVGCTVRSLSHHLALLPGYTQIEPTWRMADRAYPPGANTLELMRLLVVPFPFHIPDESFSLSREPRRLTDDLYTAGYFRLEPVWLKDDEGQDLTAEIVVNEVLRPLLEKAKVESRGEIIHGVLLPECALSAELGQEVAQLLAMEGIEFLITGALQRDASGNTKNIAQTHVVVPKNNEIGEDGMIMDVQFKHHRWRLDESQVARYALSFPDFAAAPDGRRAAQWWEDIDVANRKLPFYALRPDMSLTVLICEDLARNDPAMSVIRAVGPNLVVALLMDGPQLSVRWPARYATVLADDPGSSVLSITCAAMVDRSNWRESKPVRSIGLWRDAHGATQELSLPQGCHGMLLTLKANKKTQHTLDNRSDKDSTRQLTLKSMIPLALDRAVPWL